MVIENIQVRGKKSGDKSGDFRRKFGYPGNPEIGGILGVGVKAYLESPSLSKQGDKGEEIREESSTRVGYSKSWDFGPDTLVLDAKG